MRKMPEKMMTEDEFLKSRQKDLEFVDWIHQNLSVKPTRFHRRKR